MTAAVVSFTEAELAEVLGAPYEAVRERVVARVTEGWIEEAGRRQAELT